MIHVGLPPSLSGWLRQRFDQFRLRGAGRLRARAELLKEWALARWQSMFFVTAMRRRALIKERRMFQSFLAEFDGMVDIVCIAAREDAPEVYRNAYIKRQQSFREHFRTVQDGLKPYWQQRELESDPFVTLGEGKIEEVINSVGGIENMMTLQGIIEAYQEHLDTPVA